MNVLFITRKYPPSKGGMEKINHGIISNFPELDNAKIISWGRSQKLIPFFIVWAFLKSFYLLTFKKIDLVHFGDAALSFMASVIKKVFKVPVTVTTHGLDLTFNNKLYQFMIQKTLKDFDKITCVSTATKDIALSKGLDKDKCTVIYNGIDTSEWYLPEDKKLLRKRLENNLQRDLKDKFLLLYVGRLVKRKGMYWFIKNVFPKLDERCTLLVVSTGKEEQKINEVIKSLNLQNRILMLGKVSDEMLQLLYNSSDSFIMPNVPIKGDIEGFGIVAIEAASCGLPVIASDLEGIKDAIKEGKNGFLVQPLDVEGYVTKINEVMNLEDLDSFRKKQIDYTRENYDLKNISRQYYELFKDVLKK